MTCFDGASTDRDTNNSTTEQKCRTVQTWNGTALFVQGESTLRMLQGPSSDVANTAQRVEVQLPAGWTNGSSEWLPCTSSPLQVPVGATHGGHRGQQCEPLHSTQHVAQSTLCCSSAWAFEVPPEATCARSRSLKPPPFVYST